MIAPTDAAPVLTRAQARVLVDHLDALAKKFPDIADVNNPTAIGLALRALADGRTECVGVGKDEPVADLWKNPDGSQRFGYRANNLPPGGHLLYTRPAAPSAAGPHSAERFAKLCESQMIGSKFDRYYQHCADLIRANAAPPTAQPAQPSVPTAGEVIALNVKHPKCHEAADAFWKYWRENGETHKHGYYESTWGAINRALRLVGVVPHTYAATPAPSGEGPASEEVGKLLREHRPDLGAATREPTTYEIVRAYFHGGDFPMAKAEKLANSYVDDLAQHIRSNSRGRQ